MHGRALGIFNFHRDHKQPLNLYWYSIKKSLAHVRPAQNSKCGAFLQCFAGIFNPPTPLATSTIQSLLWRKSGSVDHYRIALLPHETLLIKSSGLVLVLDNYCVNAPWRTRRRWYWKKPLELESSPIPRCARHSLGASFRPIALSAAVRISGALLSRPPRMPVL